LEIIYNKIFLEHDTGEHPESRARLDSLGELREVSLTSDEELVHLIHSGEYIDKVKRSCQAGTQLDQDTHTSKKSFEVALQAVSATVLASECNGMAVVRPPGHHAYATYGSGFCLFNNVAIATQRLINLGKRVLIIDFDGHLGDGTESIFYNSDKALYWSLHQFPAFPFKGNVNEIGEGAGLGFTINVPLPPSSGDDIFEKALQRFLPVAKQFDPDVVAVSAGFDAHQFDPLLELRLTVDTFYGIGKLLNNEFGNVFATLEGGYNVEYLPKCFYNFLAGINGEPQMYSEPHTESKMAVIEEYELRADQLQKNLSPYWKFD